MPVGLKIYKFPKNTSRTMPVGLKIYKFPKNTSRTMPVGLKNKNIKYLCNKKFINKIFTFLRNYLL